jgi:hypothetical protein
MMAILVDSTLQRVIHEALLAQGMHTRVASGGSGESIAPGIRQIQGVIVMQNHPPHVVLTGVPGPLIHGFFLTPDHVLEVPVRAHGFGKLSLREWIQLL